MFLCMPCCRKKRRLSEIWWEIEMLSGGEKNGLCEQIKGVKQELIRRERICNMTRCGGKQCLSNTCFFSTQSCSPV